MNCQLAKNETESFNKNTSQLELHPLSETSTFSDKDFPEPHNNPPNPSFNSSFVPHQLKHTSSHSFSDLSDDIQLLKKTITHLIKSLNKNNKEKFKKKEKLNCIENFCVKNNEKIKNFQQKVSKQEEKITEIERRLSCSSSFFQVANNRAAPRVLLCEKPFSPRSGAKNINLTISSTRSGLSSLYNKKSNSPLLKT